VRSALRVREVDGEHNDMPGTSAGDAVGAVAEREVAAVRSLLTATATATVIGHGHRPRILTVNNP